MKYKIGDYVLVLYIGETHCAKIISIKTNENFKKYTYALSIIGYKYHNRIYRDDCDILDIPNVLNNEATK